METNTIVLWYVQGLVTGNPLPLQIPKSTDAQSGMVFAQNLWISSHPPVYFKSSLDYLYT